MNILIADDDPVSRELLEKVVKPFGKCKTVGNGEDALKIATSTQPPDLILLDIMMPGINGYEVCRRLKADDDASTIPVIFISAKDEQVDEAKGLKLGAVDYITKPYSTSIVTSRVRTHLELKKHRDQLEELVKERTAELVIANEKLKREMGDRQKAEEEAKLQRERLIHADKMSSIGQLAAGVAHEINNPTTFVTVNASTLEKWWNGFLPVFEKALSSGAVPVPAVEKHGEMLTKFPEIIRSIKEGAARISSITNGLKDFARADIDVKQPVDIRLILESAAMITENHYKPHADLVIEDKSLRPNLIGNSQKLEQVFVNLIINASDAIKEKVAKKKSESSHYRGRISIQTDLSGRADRELKVLVIDNGIGMGPDVAGKVFDPFFTTKLDDKGTGLGMSIAYGIIEDHGGSISVESAMGEGTSFTIALPLENERRDPGEKP